MPIPLPPVEITLTGGSGTRILNGTNASAPAAVATDISWSSVMPGGFSGADFTVSNAYRQTVNTTNNKIFGYGADVQLKIAPGYAGAGTVLYQGYLRQPTPNDDGTATMHSVGYKTLIEERNDPLLWQTQYYGDWQGADSDDFDDGFHSSEHIDSIVDNASLKWAAHKGTDVRDGNRSSLLWWGGGNDANPVHLCRRIAGRLLGSDNVGGQAGAEWSFHLERFQGPGLSGSRTDVYTFWNEMNDKNSSAFDITFGAGVGGPASVVAFTLYKKSTPNTPDKSINHTWRFWVENLRLNDIATGDSYTASSVVNDLKDRLGFGNGYVSTTSQNILPLWWQEGPWSDLMDYLCESEGNWKWGVWEQGAQGPIIEFRDWNTGNTTWRIPCYGANAQGIPQIAPSDDVYSMVDVAYKQNDGTGRVRHARKAVSPNPFAGLAAPLALRQRTYATSLNDGQPNSNFADNVAAKLAADLATERYSGTIRCTFVTDAASGNDKSCYQVRAGDKVTIPDYPDGTSPTLRVYEAQHDPEGSTLTLGRQSMRVERMIWWNSIKQKRTGRVSSVP